MNAVGKSLANGAVVSDLGIFQFYPREISIYFLRENKLTLFFAVGYQISQLATHGAQKTICLKWMTIKEQD